jgi:hypothetical protein
LLQKQAAHWKGGHQPSSGSTTKTKIHLPGGWGNLESYNAEMSFTAFALIASFGRKP